MSSCLRFTRASPPKIATTIVMSAMIARSGLGTRPLRERSGRDPSRDDTADPDADGGPRDAQAEGSEEVHPRPVAPPALAEQHRLGGDRAEGRVAPEHPDTEDRHPLVAEHGRESRHESQGERAGDVDDEDAEGERAPPPVHDEHVDGVPQPRPKAAHPGGGQEQHPRAHSAASGGSISPGTSMIVRPIRRPTAAASAPAKIETTASSRPTTGASPVSCATCTAK